MYLIDANNPPAHRCYLTSVGRGVRMVVRARCSCGWAGPVRPWGAESAAGEQADLDAHVELSGHQALVDQDFDVPVVHPRCGHLHDSYDDCPVPYDSPAGRLVRTVQASLASPEKAADRLHAASRLAEWVADQQLQAVVGARIAGLDWARIARAAGITDHQARHRWGELVQHLEDAQLVPPGP